MIAFLCLAVLCGIVYMAHPHKRCITKQEFHADILPYTSIQDRGVVSITVLNDIDKKNICKVLANELDWISERTEYPCEFNCHQLELAEPGNCECFFKKAFWPVPLRWS